MPFMLPDPDKAGYRDPSWIGDYVQRLLKQVNLPKVNITPNSAVDSDVFETHKSVIVRVTVPKAVNPNLIRVWINTHHVRIEGIPDTRQKHTIALPAPVLAKSGRAVFKDGVLEIRIPKYSSERGYKEIYVQFTD